MSNHWLYVLAKQSEIIGAIKFRNLLGMLSGSSAFLESN